MRLKPKIEKIYSIEEANDILKEVGLLQIELDEIDAEAQRGIIAIREKALLRGESIRGRIEELSNLIGNFAQYNKEGLFSDKKSITLTFGVFGFRKSTSIHVKKSTLELLKKFKMDRFIRVKEEPNKDLMAELSDIDLAKVDAHRKNKDDFFLEANREEINKLKSS